jgi:predicted nucleic-acid-binding Zn-ribbon protein
MVSLLFWVPVGILVILIVCAELWTRYEQLSCVECGYEKPYQWVEEKLTNEYVVVGAYLTISCPKCKTKNYQRYARRIQ